MNKQKVMAIIRNPEFGIDDRGNVSLRFAIYDSPGSGAGQHLFYPKYEEVIKEYEVSDVSQLDGKPCWALLGDGILQFDSPMIIR